MKILIINWRSVKDPLAGGAEKTTFEHCKRWVKNHNAEVTWLSSKYSKDIDNEEIEGVKFEYVGSFLNRDKISVILISFPIYYFLVIFHYFKKYRGKIDLVIEEIHGIPYLTPLYIKENKIVYIHEIAGEIWDKMFNFPINIIGKNIEKFFFKFYSIVTFITASKSSEKDLIDIGIKRKKIHIVEHGISLKPISSATKKYPKFTLVFLNRMVKMKGPERALEIFEKFLHKFPNSKLLMVGGGEEEYVNSLKNLAKTLSIDKKVEFKGFVSEEEKVEILQKSNVLLNTSYKEGWGLVNLEANSQGTPAVVFDVEGCRDSIKNGINGYISTSEKSFLENIEKIMKNDLSQSSLEYSRKFNYDIKSEDFWKIINS